MSEVWSPSTLCDRVGARGLGIIETLLADLGGHADPGNPLAMIGPAARGELEAQRSLVAYGFWFIYQHLATGDMGDQTAALAETITFARLADAQGDTADRVNLATALALGAMFAWSEHDRLECAAECLARLELLADAGDERAADLLASFAGTESPEVLQGARVFRDRLLAVKEAE